MKTYIAGLDLSGPSNTADTVLLVFELSNDVLHLCKQEIAASDDAILNCLSSLQGKIYLGIDAPLSYNQGGGDRRADSELRKLLIQKGLRPGTVMPPTLTRMAYLTLRGISVARLLQTHIKGIEITEVHPGGAMALAGAPVEQIKEFKRCYTSREELTEWLRGRGIMGISPTSDHYLAAAAASFATWKWQRGESSWKTEAVQPHHPFDFCC